MLTTFPIPSGYANPIGRLLANRECTRVPDRDDHLLEASVYHQQCPWRKSARNGHGGLRASGTGLEGGPGSRAGSAWNASVGARGRKRVRGSQESSGQEGLGFRPIEKRTHIIPGFHI